MIGVALFVGTSIKRQDFHPLAPLIVVLVDNCSAFTKFAGKWLPRSSGMPALSATVAFKAGYGTVCPVF
jgi:hypothetical protein